MKIKTKALACLLAVFLLGSCLPTLANAKDLEPCNLCHTTGRYECHNCHGQILEQGELDGGWDLYVYHRAADNSAECLGKAEYGTYPDGSVEWLSFNTESFSDFFTAREEIDTRLPEAMPNPDGTGGKGLDASPAAEATGQTTDPAFFIVAAVLGVVLIAGVAVFLIIRKKKRK